MAKDNKAQIDFITKHLRAGKERNYILQHFTKIYKVSTKTFDNRLKIAKELLAVENKTKEDIRQSLLPEQVKAEIEANIASEQEIDLALSKIVMGNCTVEEFIQGKAVLRGIEPMEIIAAADKLYKRKGSYAPAKSDLTTNGESLNQGVVLSNGNTINLG